MPRILGLDPGLGTTGWGLIQAEGNRLSHIANGQLKTSASESLPKRLSHLASQLEALLADHSPEAAAVEEVFGYSASEIVGQDIFLLQPESVHWSSNGGLKKYLKSAVTGGNWRARETLGRKKDGSEFPVEVAFSNIEIDDSTCFIAFFRRS